MANLQSCRGMDFVVVNEVSGELLNLITKALECWEDDYDHYDNNNEYPTMREHFKYLGGGYCGRVFELNEDTVIKVESGAYRGDDGVALHQLQGLPFVPKVYMYTNEEEFSSITIMEKIKGVTVTEYLKGKAPFSLLRAPKNLTQEVENFIITAALEKGIVIRDVKSDNCMIDEQGNFFMIDYGVFDFTDSDRYKRHCEKYGQYPNYSQIKKMHVLTTFIEKVAGQKLGREHLSFANTHNRTFGCHCLNYYYYSHPAKGVCISGHPLRKTSNDSFSEKLAPNQFIVSDQAVVGC